MQIARQGCGDKTQNIYAELIMLIKLVGNMLRTEYKFSTINVFGKKTSKGIASGSTIFVLLYY
jgi:hypothetical protein